MTPVGNKTDSQSQHAQQVARLENEVRGLRERVRRSQRMASLGTMAAMVAHEFNNILTPIINYAHLAQGNPALTEKAIAKAADGGERARVICRAILGMSGEECDELADASVAELVSETLSAMARDPRKDGIELRLNVPEGLRIRTRRIELEQVLMNLLLNARRAVLKRGRSGHIDVAVAVVGGKCVMSVADDGVGIPPEDIEKVFEPFFSTGDKDVDDDGGSGLGLTICQEIVQAMEGEIDVHSRLGEGTTFTITMPLAA
jgi:signal transduction histidine kinase